MPAQDLNKQPNYTLKLLNMEPGIPQNRSHQHLVNDTEESQEDETGSRSIRDVTIGEWITVIILCFVNLINYMDRFTLAGILTDIQDYYKINDSEGGLLQTAFILSYMIFAPLFGYMGDRYSRRMIMAFGVFLWSLTTFVGSYMESFPVFVIFRALVGIGEASYSTIAPTIISDLFVKDIRSKMLALFYFAIPVGSGLGYIVGSETARIAGSWQWGLRVTPILGAAAVLLIIFVLKDPERGQSEGGGHLTTTSWFEDVADIVKNPSFILSTIGFTCVAFVAGALAWWGPKFIYLGIKLQPGGEDVQLNDVSYKFGILAMVSGLIGVPAGSFLAQVLRIKYPNIDPLVCGIGMIISSPMVFFACVTAGANTAACFFFVFLGEVFLNLTWSLVADILLFVFSIRWHYNVGWHMWLKSGLFFESMAKEIIPKYRSIICGAGLLTSAPLLLLCTYAAPKNSYICFVLLFFGQVALNLNWAIVGDILLYVVVPTRRSTAEGFQLLVSHALGDAGSPYLIGILSDALRIALRQGSSNSDDGYVQFKALQYSLFTTCFVEIIGGIVFLVTAIFIVKDRTKVDKYIKDAVENERAAHILAHETERRTLMS